MKRIAKLGAAAYVLLAALGLALGGLFYPPALAPVRAEASAPDTDEFWDGLETVSLTLEDGVELGGVQCLLGGSSPLVVHFMESGGAVSPARGFGLQFGDRYDQLADLGYSSIAFDYRGVGLSKASSSSTKLASDCAQVYRHALDLVDGDESRLVLRASSLGTMMVADLLANGARPGALIAFGPVEAESAARRYTAQFWWGGLYWPVAPFLKGLVRAQTLKELTRAECPVLIVTDPDDCFISSEEVAALARDADAKGSLNCIASTPKIWSSGVKAPGFQRHVSIVRQARRVQPAERSLLAHVPIDSAVIESRVEALLESLDPAVSDLVLSDEAALVRLRTILKFDRRVFPNAAAAAALRLRDEELQAARPWITSHWFREAPGVADRSWNPADVQCPATAGRLMAVFDLSDGLGGRWPIEDVMKARAMLGRYSSKGGIPNWTGPNVEALALALSGKVEEANAVAAAVPVPAAGGEASTRVSFSKQDVGLWIELECEGVTLGRSVIPTLFTVDLESYLREDQPRFQEVLLPLLKKAAWLR